jgi:hypothetical protein
MEYLPQGNDMASNKSHLERKVSYRKSGSDMYFSIKGDSREYLIDLGSEARVVTHGPDLIELVLAIERAWIKECLAAPAARRVRAAALRRPTFCRVQIDQAKDIS